MNRRVTSTADVLGLDRKIGGHDRLVVLWLLALVHAETGKPASAEELAGPSQVRPEDLAEGPLAGLIGAGYAELKVAQTLTDPPWEVGRKTFTDATPSVGLIQRTGYRITTEGLKALDGHLSALGALPRSLEEHLFGQVSGEAAPEEGPQAPEEGR